MRSPVWLAKFIAAGVIAIAVLRMWAHQAERSLWLDETATHYLVSGTWSELVDRLALHPQMSPGYYVVLKALGTLGMPLEMGLRWQSLAALAAATALLYRLGTRLFECRCTALFAAAIFVASPEVADHGCNARPYALALLCVIASALFLFRWFDSGGSIDAVGFVVASGAMIWVHYTTALMLLPYGAYALERRTPRVCARDVAWAGAAIVALAAPLLIPMLRSWRSAGALSFMPAPTFRSLAATLALPVMAGLGPKCLDLAARHRAAVAPVWRGAGSAPRVVWLWALLPPLLTFVAATTTPAKLFLGRYHVAMFAATALLLAGFIQSLPVALVRNVTLIAVLGIYVRSPPYVEDWRGAAQAVHQFALGPETPILLISGYVEALDPAYLDDPRYRTYLGSPLFSYPVTGRTVLLPDRIGAGLGMPGRVERLTDHELESASRIVLLSRSGAPAAEWVRARALKRGFSPRSLGEFPRVTAVLLEPRAQTVHARQ